MTISSQSEAVSSNKLATSACTTWNHASFRQSYDHSTHEFQISSMANCAAQSEVWWQSFNAKTAH